MRRPRKPWKLALLVAGCLVVTWMVASAIVLWDAVGRTGRGADELEAAAALADRPLAEVPLDEVAAHLAEADAELDRADQELGTWFVRPVGWFPVIGRQFRSAEALVSTFAVVSGDAERVAEEAIALEDTDDPAERPDRLRSLGSALEDLQASLDAADLGPDRDLVGPLADARNDAAVRIAELRTDLRPAAGAMSALADLLDGARYLVLGTNNSEMRMGAGMALSIGELSSVDGRFRLGRFEASDDLFPIPGTAIEDPWMEPLWGFARPTNDFRKLGYTARFDDWVAPTALRMWEAETGRSLDGVLLVDPFVLDALLGLSGPVTLPDGEEVGQGRALEYLLVDQYREFAPEAETEAEEAGELVEERRDRLADLAAAAVSAIGTADLDPLELAQTLAPLADGRHLLLHSRDVEAQAAWESLGLAGSLHSDMIGVHPMNFGASKLDPFLRVEVRAERLDETTVELTTTITNTVDPAGLAPYAAGPWEGFGLPEAGTYKGRLAVIGPGDGAADPAFVGRPTYLAGPDGPVRVALTEFEVRPGRAVEIVAEVDVGSDETAVELLPSARFPAVTWRWGSSEVDDSEPVGLELADLG